MSAHQSFQGFGLTGEGAFGFNAGANFGVPLNWLTCGFASGQIGLNSVHSSLGEDFVDSVNHQLFFTGGIFRRVDYGLQGGAVADVLDSSWYTDPRVVQVRGELSWAYPAGHSLGYRFQLGVQDFDDPQDRELSRSALDTHRFFYQHPLCGGGFGELFAGFTDESQALFGVDYDVAMSECVALRSGFTYLVPAEGDEEAWNIGLSLVFRPRGSCWYQHYHRPMFPVADNGTLIIRR